MLGDGDGFKGIGAIGHVRSYGTQRNQHTEGQLTPTEADLGRRVLLALASDIRDGALRRPQPAKLTYSDDAYSEAGYYFGDSLAVENPHQIISLENYYCIVLVIWGKMTRLRYHAIRVVATLSCVTQKAEMLRNQEITIT